MTPEQLEKERREARLKAQRDLSTAQKVARKEEMQKGMEIGILAGIIRYNQQHLGEPVTPADELFALPQEELRRLAERLGAVL